MNPLENKTPSLKRKWEDETPQGQIPNDSTGQPNGQEDSLMEPELSEILEAIPASEMSVSQLEKIEQNKVQAEIAKQKIDSSQEPPQKKRKKEEAPPQIAISPNTETPITQEAYLHVLNQISTCFNIPIEKLKEIAPLGSSLEKLAALSYSLTSEGIKKLHCFDTTEIESIYHLFFESPISSISNQDYPKILENLHPTHIFKNLFGCLKALEPYENCEGALRAKDGFIKLEMEKYVVEQEIINSESPNRVLQQIKTAYGDGKDAIKLVDQLKVWIDNPELHQSHLKETLKDCPIISTRDLFMAENLSKTFVLKDQNGTNQWIFKPIDSTNLEDYDSGYLNNQEPHLAKSECMAHLINFNGSFPIPTTIYVNIKGWIGSAQCMIDNTKSLSQIQPPLNNNLFAFKLLIFDLMFVNSDRHQGNLLHQQQGATVKIYGIDHGQCMLGEKEMKLEYFYHFTDMKKFPRALTPLVNGESCKKYEEIMELHKINESLINWMKMVGPFLETAIDEGKDVRKIVDYVRLKWEVYRFGEEVELDASEIP